MPQIDSTQRTLKVKKEDTSAPIAIGSGKTAFLQCLEQLRAVGDEFHRTARLPLIAIEKLISTEVQSDVGGAIQLAFAKSNGVDLLTRASPIVFGKPEGKIFFLGIELQELGRVGPCEIGLTGLA